MGSEMAPVVQAYTEIGILGLLAVIFVILVWKSFANKNKDDNWKNGKIDKKDDILENDKQTISKQLQDLTNILIKQSEENLAREREMNKELMQQIIDGVNNHSLSHIENSKLTDVNKEVDIILKDILNETNASRASLVQYHNGGKSINKQAFLKMSMTNEKTKLGVKSIMSECKDQFRSALGYFVNELSDNGHCCIFDVEQIKEVDVGMYELMVSREVEAKCGYAIHDKENNMVIAYICVEFEHKEDAIQDVIRKSFTEHYREIERLLNS